MGDDQMALGSWNGVVINRFSTTNINLRIKMKKGQNPNNNEHIQMETYPIWRLVKG